MHSYLRSIGFAKALKSEHETELLLEKIYHTAQRREAVREDDGNRAFLELSRSFGPHIGIRICGELEPHGFRRLTYFPYLEGSAPTTYCDVMVEKRSDGCSFAVLAEEGRIGVSLISYLQNPARYRKESFEGRFTGTSVSTTLTGLSLSGMILLPGKGSRCSGPDDHREAYYQKHDQMVLAAKNGSQEAIESLTMEDMDTYAMLARRVQHEDVLTIVDSCFMPSGMECDQYQIIGTIEFYTKVQNEMTGENLYQLSVNCNGMLIDVCINSCDLLGDPEEGRRFKGNVWLQGRLNFE